MSDRLLMGISKTEVAPNNVETVSALRESAQMDAFIHTITAEALVQRYKTGLNPSLHNQQIVCN